MQDEFDSADDLELNDSMEDDVISFQKIPATQTKLNAHLFSAPSHAQEEIVLKDVQSLYFLLKLLSPSFLSRFYD